MNTDRMYSNRGRMYSSRTLSSSSSAISESFGDELDRDVENTGACCPALCTNCTPRRIRINLVAFAFLFLFSAGASVGAYNRVSEAKRIYSEAPPPDKSPVAAPSQDVGGDDPTGGDSKEDNSSEDEAPVVSVDSPYLVGAYYYPWYGTNFHNGEGYIRRDLIPPQAPSLGEYDDSDPAVVAQHLRWSRQANIGLWVTSWWGPDLLEDRNTKDVILQHEDLGDMKIALHYETSGRIPEDDTSNVAPDIAYMCQTYFSHPNYYRIDGKPVLVIYISRDLETKGILDDVLQRMRSTASSYGHDLYIIGDHIFGAAPDLADTYDSFEYFDAVTNYDVYGSMGRPMRYAGTAPIDDYYTEQLQWRTKAILSGCRYIPAASPGYNDRAVRQESNHPPLSRKLSAESEEGSTFKYQLKRALNLVDPMANNMILINSFNEWHEDTQLEPAFGDAASLPVHLTGGLQYVPYGELYLNILREHTESKIEDAYKSSSDGD
eukprot:scaffold558_cov111-Cylindrotheca_fusiformis.AAC.15